jgi:hypothetical protein
MSYAARIRAAIQQPNRASAPGVVSPQLDAVWRRRLPARTGAATLLSLLLLLGCHTESGRDAKGSANRGGAGGEADAGVRRPTCAGSTERCNSARCMAGQACVTCPTGTVCVEVEVSCGPAAASTAQCVPDPCAGSELSCACSDAVCQQAGETMACTVYGRSHFLVGSDGSAFVSCTAGTP